MALKIKLKPNERVIVNGAVIRNDDRRTVITVENHSHVIRGSDVMLEDDATTPAKRAYFVIQSLLIDQRHNFKERKKQAAELLADLYTAIRNAEMHNAVAEANWNLACEDYYKALVALRPVIAYERRLFENVSEEPESKAA
jgi:Flagellar biosynthesis regulator FlbT